MVARPTLERLAVLFAALWWGSLSTLGFMVVPLLFARLGSPAVAGGMAAQLFQAQTWLSVACGAGLLLILRSNRLEASVQRSLDAMTFVVLGLLLALLSEFAVAPRIVARENLRLWHAVGSALYLLQWACAGWTLWRRSAPPSSGAAPLGGAVGASAAPAGDDHSRQ